MLLKKTAAVIHVLLKDATVIQPATAKIKNPDTLSGIDGKI